MMGDASLEQLSATELLDWALRKFGQRLVITTSFQAEGMAVIAMAAKLDSRVRVSTLDTGRLPQETYDMIEAVRNRYGIAVEVVTPDTREIEAMMTMHGPNLMYASVAHRRLCCELRKVRPLERALAGADAYVVGLRREQSETRANVAKVTEQNGRLKISPLADWTRTQLENYIRENDVPLHPLYAAGYQSIGCAPCTRATQPGESERAGRWWWETDEARECGLHYRPDGKIERTIDVLLSEVLQEAHGEKTFA